MARDTVTNEADATEPKAPADGAGSGPAGSPVPSPLPRRIGRALRRIFLTWSGRSARFLDYLSVDSRRRSRASLVLAIALNTILFTALAVFGRFEIWIPNAPGDTMSVVMVDLPPAPEPPETDKPEIAPEPKPEPKPAVEPKPKPDLAEQPEPPPVEKPKPEPPPEPPPAPEPAKPEPKLDLTPEPVFTPPSDAGEAPAVPEPETAPADELGPPAVEEQPPPEAPDEAEQAPAQEAPPLVEEEATPEPLPEAAAAPEPEDASAPEPEKEENTEPEPAAPSEPAPTKPEPPANDDMFDEEPVFGRPRAPLPGVDLPQGEAATTPGSSGVVAIFCDQQFTDKDKIAECAGRTEIRSGWRPGASGEDWSEATRLLKTKRAEGKAGVDPSAIYGADVGRRMRDANQTDELNKASRGVGELNDPAGAAAHNLNDTLGQPDVGPKPFEPSWTLPDDPNVSRKDVEKLKKDLEEAEKNKQP